MFKLAITAQAFVNSIQTISSEKGDFVAIKARATSGSDDKKESHLISFNLPVNESQDLAEGDLIELSGTAWPKPYKDKEGNPQIIVKVSNPIFSVKKKRAEIVVA